MPGSPAARIGDLTAHGGRLGPPVVPPPRFGTVFIEKQIAAVTGCVHVCPVDGTTIQPNVVLANPITLARPVLVNGVQLASTGTLTTCTAPIMIRPATVTVGGV